VECAGRRFKPIGRGFGSVSQQAAPDCLIDGLGHDDGDRLGDKADPISRNRVISRRNRAGASNPHGDIRRTHEPCTMRDRREPIGDVVAASEHGEHTRRRKSCCFVDGSNVCMSMGRAHNYGVRQSGQLDIVGEAALPGQETRILLAPHRLTDTVRHAARRVHALYSWISACCADHC
jgi:hypothetical protein